MRDVLRATMVAWFVAALTTACGGSQSTPAQGSPSPLSSSQKPPGGGTSVQHLGWDQYAPNAEELRRYAFVLYVDGALTPLANATCGSLAGDTSTAPCSAPLPGLTSGQHTLEMATRMTENGVVLESARSAPITYTMGATGFASGTAEANSTIPGAGTGAASGDTGSGTGLATGESPFIVETVLTGLDRPSALARLPDGRLLIAEQGGTIRIAERGGVLLPESAAQLPDADPAADAVVSLAVAPDFEISRHVYVGYGAVDARGSRRGRVVRLREAGGVLGEPAVILDDLPAAVTAPWVAIGPDGSLYVATSSPDDGEAADIGSYAGKILRFGLDGTTPPDNPLPASPLFSYGFRGAAGIDWDGQAGSLWALETDNEGSALALAAAGGPGRRVASLGPIGPARMAFLSASAAKVPASWRGSLFIAAPDEQCLLRVSGLAASPLTPNVEGVLNGFGRIVAVLSAEDGLYFATANRAAAAEGQTVDAVYRVCVTTPPR